MQWPSQRRPRRSEWTRAGIVCPLVCCFLASGGCREDPSRRCARLFGSESYEAAAVECELLFEQTRDPRAGAMAARALRFLGRDDETLEWVARLEGSDQEATAWGLAADVHRRRGETELARRAYQQILVLDRLTGDHARLARAHYGLYYLAWQASDFRQALDHLHRASEEAARARDRALEATTFEGLFSLLLEIGDLGSAEHALQRAHELSDPEDPDRRKRLLFNEGLIRLRQGRMALARRAFLGVLETAEADEERGFLRSTHLNLVESYLSRGELDEAEHHLTQAWTHAEPDGSKRTGLLFYQAWSDHARGRYAQAADAVRLALSEHPVRDWEWELEHRAGLIAEAVGDLGAAEAAYRRAIEIVETMRGSLESDEYKAWLLDKKRGPYEALFRQQARRGDAEAALETAERAKARAFLDAFVRATALAEISSDRTWPTAAADRLETLQKSLPLVSHSAIVELRPVDRLLAVVGSRHLLLYFEAGHEFWLITVAGDRILTRLLPGTVSEVRGLVNRFIAAPGDAGLSAELGRILLPPETLPLPGSRISIVPDGALGRLPFSALRVGERYLVEDHEIDYVPSLNALAAITGRPRDELSEAVVLGDPLGDLPAAALEAREVAGLLGVPARTGEDATIERLRQASGAGLLHLATHTGLGPRGPWLALADGEVTASWVVEARLRPRLAVIATCASAARRGRGMWGSLGAAFLAAGSEAVLSSLWSVEDQTARSFVERFYREGGTTDAARALARTQRALIADGAPPSRWAPFVLFGPGAPLLGMDQPH